MRHLLCRPRAEHLLCRSMSPRKAPQSAPILLFRRSTCVIDSLSYPPVGAPDELW